jgi:hypothetical protein
LDSSIKENKQREITTYSASAGKPLMNHGDHHGSCSESDNDSGGNDSEAQDFNKTEQEELLADMLE